MLSGDYLCFATLAIDRGSDPQCRLCLVDSNTPAPIEDTVHILTRCRGTADTRNRLMPDLLNTVHKFFPNNKILEHTDHLTLTQFILDCSSLNLPSLIRIEPSHTEIVQVVRISHDLCFAIHTERVRQLKNMGLLNRN